MRDHIISDYKTKNKLWMKLIWIPIWSLLLLVILDLKNQIYHLAKYASMILIVILTLPYFCLVAILYAKNAAKILTNNTRIYMRFSAHGTNLYFRVRSKESFLKTFHFLRWSIFQKFLIRLKYFSAKSIILSKFAFNA